MSVWENIEIDDDTPTNVEMLAKILSPHWHPGPPRIEGAYLVWTNEHAMELTWLESDDNSLQYLSNCWGDEVTGVVCHFPIPSIPERLRG